MLKNSEIIHIITLIYFFIPPINWFLAIENVPAMGISPKLSIASRVNFQYSIFMIRFQNLGPSETLYPDYDAMTPLK
jgi:hypothetical protein